MNYCGVCDDTVDRARAQESIVPKSREVTHQSPDQLADFRCETTGTRQVPVVVSTEGSTSSHGSSRARYSTCPALNAATTSVRLTNANLRNTCVMCALT